MKTRIEGGREAILILLFVTAFCLRAAAQWQIGEQVLSPPPRGNYYSLRLGTNGPPLPFCPSDVPVYFLGTIPGTTNLAFAYDDRDVSSAGRSSTQTAQDAPPVPGDDNGGGGGGNTNAPPPPPQGCDYGTNLYLLIGPTSVVTGGATNREAWLVLTNTESPKYYQIQSRLRVVEAPWEPGEIVQATGATHQVQFSNVRADDVSQRFFRGAGGDTVASIALDPDYNLAVEPGSPSESPQIGKFRVSLSPAPSSSVVVVYQVSGSASNGVDYTSLGGSVTVEPSPGFATIEVHPLYDTLAEFDESVTLTLVLTDSYLVGPKRASATMKIYDPRPEGMAVAIHDSGWTRWFGLSTTNWNYFVMPESVKEALRSDGTPYVVVSDLDIANGVLMTNGAPKYPILISLAAEVIRDDEITPLALYLTNGGFILAGSSSFTRYTNGTNRADFALTSQMGLSCSPSTANWLDKTNFIKQSGHRLVSDIPAGELVWRMPTSAEEVSWGTCAEHSDGGGYDGAHQIWQVSASGTNVLARGENASPYLVVTPYGSGQFIYHAALQPLVGHGGHAPSMYAYMIFRRAIEWAFECAQRPVPKVSPWPYDYDAAFIVRHDLENIVNRITNINVSASYEQQWGAKGDYYFCTGAITNLPDFEAVKAGLQAAVSNYGATIGPHNGGSVNPLCVLNPLDYDYWHWGPDEALDLLGGSNYAYNSMSISWAQMDAWVGTNETRLWVAPYFNATREGSYGIQEQLGVKITGDQKLTPFPHWTLSTQSDGKRYSLLSEPTSEWFVNRTVAQSLEAWPPPDFHTFLTMHNGVDFYYGLGALVNLYSHTLATGLGEAGYLTPDYILYCANTNIHPRMWPANATDVYNWWLQRSSAQLTAVYSTDGEMSVATVSIAGAQHEATAVELLIPGNGSLQNLTVRTNGGSAAMDTYRTDGRMVKVRVGPEVTTVEARYFLGPRAGDDTFTVRADQPSVGAPGVLANDTSPKGGALSAIKTGGDGGVTLSSNGGFTCPSAVGRYTFTYEANDGQSNSLPATVEVLVLATNAWVDDFTRLATDTNPLAGWTGHWGYGVDGDSTVTDGKLVMAAAWYSYGIVYTNATWTNYSVEARIRFAPGAGGGGLGGRLNSADGSRYAAWIYPEGSPGGSNLLQLIRFDNWTGWIPLGDAQSLSAVGTNWHTVKLMFEGSQIRASCDGIETSWSDSTYASGGVSLDMYNWAPPDGGPSYNMSVDDVILTPSP